jgi:hypothetical protein
LSLFERLNVSSNQSNENAVLEEHDLLSGQYKGKCIAVRLVIKLRNAKRSSLTMSETTET